MNRRLKMYIDYKRELCSLTEDKSTLTDGLLSPLDGYISDANFLQHDLNSEWRPIVYDSREVGFLIVVSGSLVTTGTDYEVAESYVEPEFRRKGLMTKAVYDFALSHPGTYGLDIMKEPGAIGKSFWPTIPDGKRIIQVGGIVESKDRTGDDCLLMRFKTGENI